MSDGIAAIALVDPSISVPGCPAAISNFSSPAASPAINASALVADLAVGNAEPLRSFSNAPPGAIPCPPRSGAWAAALHDRFGRMSTTARARLPPHESSPTAGLLRRSQVRRSGRLSLCGLASWSFGAALCLPHISREHAWRGLADSKFVRLLRARPRLLKDFYCKPCKTFVRPRRPLIDVEHDHSQWPV